MKTSNNKQKQNKDYMSLSKISYGYDLNPKWAADKWLSEPSTLEFIQLWENLHNIDFNKEAYIDLCSCALSVGSSPSVYELQKMSNIKSMFVDKEFDGEIFMHKDIAIDFASWASPAFRTFCLLTLQDKENICETNFVSEEDFIIGAKSLAEFTKKNAFRKYKQELTKQKQRYPHYLYCNSNNS